MPCKQLCVPLGVLDYQTVQTGKGHQQDPRSCDDMVHQRNAVVDSTNLCWHCR